jgi:hypothetical protein
MNAAVIPESIAQLQLQLDQIRSTQPRGKKPPDSVWHAAVELAREHGVYSVAHHLRLDYAGLKKRLGGVSHRRRKARPLSLGKLRKHGKPGKPRGPRQERSLALHYVALKCLAQKQLKSGYPNWNIW